MVTYKYEVQGSRFFNFFFAFSSLEKSNTFTIKIKNNQKEENKISHNLKFSEVELSFCDLIQKQNEVMVT